MRREWFTPPQPKESTMNSFFDNLCIAVFVLGFGLVAPAMSIAVLGGLF